MNSFDFPYKCESCGHEVTISFTPGRPPPPCSNPNSPAFSDSGDPDEWEPAECPQCGFEYDSIRIGDAATANMPPPEQDYEPYCPDSDDL